MNLKTPGPLSVFGIAIAAGCLGLPFQPKEEATAIVGDCAEFDCSELLNELEESFPDKINQAKSECSENQFIGMKVWGDWEQEDSRVVSLTCWEPERYNEGGYRQGFSLGSFPVPGAEDSFGSSWKCYNPLCEEQVNALQYTYPEEMRSHEIECGFIGGELNLLISEAKEEVDIQCVFYGGVLLADADDDGIPDWENNKGSLVDNILGSFPLQ